MAKHNMAEMEKRERNLAYAMKYRQRVCRNCKHRSVKKRFCPMCGGAMRDFRS